MNLEERDGSVIASSQRQSEDFRPQKASTSTRKSQASGTEEDTTYDDEEFDSAESPGLSSTHATPRLSWMEREHDMIDMSTQTVVHSGTLKNNYKQCLWGFFVEVWGGW